MSWPFYPQGRSSWYPLDRRLVGPRPDLDAVVKRKIAELLPGIEPRIIQSVAQSYTTELPWLRVICKRCVNSCCYLLSNTVRELCNKVIRLRKIMFVTYLKTLLRNSREKTEKNHDKLQSV
jgi:hypothetical protein